MKNGLTLICIVSPLVASSDFTSTFSVIPAWIVHVLFTIPVIGLFIFIATRKLRREVERKVTELRANETKFRALFDNSSQLMGLLDCDGTVRAANFTALSMINAQESDLVGIPFWETPWWRHSEELQMLLREGIVQCAEGEKIQFEATHLDGAGKSRAIDFYLTPVFNESGGVDFLIAFGYDMTHLKEIEDRDRHLQKMEAIGTLAGGIAHDFNNILAAMFGYLDLAALEEHENVHLHEAHDEIRNAANRARDLVSQILTFSRKGTPDRSPILLSNVVGEALKLIRSSLPTSIAMDTRISCDDYILGNSTQIHQVVMNLCTNAWHAMQDQTSGLLSVSLRHVPSAVDLQELHPGLLEQEYLELKISDTGSGMDMAVSEQVFNPYFTTKEQGKGTGLGLSMVHTIIASHDGVISLQSKSGVGTIFTILFPKIEYTPKESATVPVAVSTPENSTIHVLFVDDESMIVKSTKRFLEHEGFTVTAFTDSVQALEAFESTPQLFSVVVSDMSMPFMDGVDLLKTIKQINTAVPVVLCSGFNQREQELREEMPEINRFLQKPIALNQLVDEIRDILSKPL